MKNKQKKASKVADTNKKKIEREEPSTLEKQALAEDIAEDICQVIEESEKNSKTTDKNKMKDKKENTGVFAVKTIIGITAFAVILYWALNNADTVFSGLGTFIGYLSPLIIGFFIAFIINTILVPLERLWKKLLCKKGAKNAALCEKLKRPVCLLLSALLSVGAIFAVLFMIIPELKNTITTFAQMFPQFIEKLEIWLSELSQFLDRYGIKLPEINLDAQEIIRIVNTFVTEKGQMFFNKTVDITTSVFSAIFNFVLGFVFSVYLLSKKEKVGKKLCDSLYALLPKRGAQAIIKVSSLTSKTFTNFVTGQLTEAVIIGALCFIGMLVFGMPYAPVISVLIGATALIPIFGAFIGTAIGAVLILSVDFYKAFWFIIFIIVLQQIESNLIYPRVVGKSVGLPGILVLLAVTLGTSIFGFVGMLLSVPVCSVIYCVFSEFVSKRLEDKQIK